MNIWKHFKEQPFIVLVALAALPHTAWAIGTYTQGVQPSVSDWPSLVTALAWLVPPLAFAIAMDIGQVVTAGEIRAGNRSKWLVATFYSLAIFTYICQLLHGMHHYPKLEIGSGAAPFVVSVGSIISQCAVFVLPVLLPAATVLYAMAYHQPEKSVQSDSEVWDYEDVADYGYRDAPDFLEKQVQSLNGHGHAKSAVTGE